MSLKSILKTVNKKTNLKVHQQIVATMTSLKVVYVFDV
jgi:hypothetical protein